MNSPESYLPIYSPSELIDTEAYQSIVTNETLPVAVRETVAHNEGQKRGFMAAQLLVASVHNEQEAELRYMNSHDQLTGLLNKAAWKQDVERRMERGQKIGIGLLDMDAFKAVNDTIGHGPADELLIAFSNYLSDRFQRRTDTIAHERMIGETEVGRGNVLSRWGGDEFAVTFDLSDGDDHEAAENGVQNRRRPVSTEGRMRIEAAYMQSVLDDFVAGQPDAIRQLGFNISFGYTTWDPERNAAVSPSEVYHAADQAMFEAKRGKRR